MKVLVTGAKGQLGTDLMNELEKRGIEGIGVDVQEMDITDAKACRRVIKNSGADAVIVREKDLKEREYEELARRVIKICERAQISCILHTRKRRCG